MIAALVALAAAAAYAVASVLQQHEAARQTSTEDRRGSLLTRLLRRPLWLLGLVADAGGYVLQFIALGIGSINVVQPLLVVGLLLALPVSAAIGRHQMTRAEWLGAVALVVGLSAFLLAAHPAQGVDDTTTRTWLVVIAATVAPAAALSLLAARRTGAVRAAAYATASGLLYAFAAAASKTSAHLLTLGVVHLVTAWQPYAVVATGIVGLSLSQSAFQADRLSSSLPLLTVVDPAASIFIGAFAFHEAMRNSPVAIAVELVSLVLVGLGIVPLSRAGAMV